MSGRKPFTNQQSSGAIQKTNYQYHPPRQVRGGRGINNGTRPYGRGARRSQTPRFFNLSSLAEEQDSLFRQYPQSLQGSAIDDDEEIDAFIDAQEVIKNVDQATSNIPDPNGQKQATSEAVAETAEKNNAGAKVPQEVGEDSDVTRKRTRFTPDERYLRFEAQRNERIRQDCELIKEQKGHMYKALIDQNQQCEEMTLKKQNLKETDKVGNMAVHQLVGIIQSLQQPLLQLSTESAAIASYSLARAQDNQSEIIVQDSKNKQIENKIDRIGKQDVESKKRIKEVEDAKDTLVIKVKVLRNDPLNPREPNVIKAKALKVLTEIPGLETKFAKAPKNGSDPKITQQKIAPDDIRNAFMLIPKNKEIIYDNDGISWVPLGVRFNTVTKCEEVFETWRKLDQEQKQIHRIQQFIPRHKMQDDRKFSQHRFNAALKNIKGENAPFAISGNPHAFYIVQENGLRHVNRTCRHSLLYAPKVEDPTRLWDIWYKKMAAAKELITGSLKDQLLEELKIQEFERSLVENLTTRPSERVNHRI